MVLALEVGLIDEGIVSVIVFVVLPKDVLPLYVVQVRMQETVVPEVFWLARLNGGVHEILVLLDFVTMVPVALPTLYVMVCV